MEHEMNDYSMMQDLSDWRHERYMRWVHDERGTVEVVGVVNDDAL